jgi:hypothetical protein
MRVKYILEKNEDNQLTIGEYSALDKKDHMMFTLLCDQTYEGSAIEAAIATGKEDLVDVLRTIDLYPQEGYMDTLSDMVVAMYGPEGKASMEVVIDDADLLSDQAKERELLEDLDEIIEDDTDDTDEFDELLKGDEDIPTIKTTLQVVDEEAIDVEKKLD